MPPICPCPRRMPLMIQIPEHASTCPWFCAACLHGPPAMCELGERCSESTERECLVKAQIYRALAHRSVSLPAEVWQQEFMGGSTELIREMFTLDEMFPLTQESDDDSITSSSSSSSSACAALETVGCETLEASLESLANEPWHGPDEPPPQVSTPSLVVSTPLHSTPLQWTAGLSQSKAESGGTPTKRQWAHDERAAAPKIKKTKPSPAPWTDALTTWPNAPEESPEELQGSQPAAKSSRGRAHRRQAAQDAMDHGWQARRHREESAESVDVLAACL